MRKSQVLALRKKDGAPLARPLHATPRPDAVIENHLDLAATANSTSCPTSPLYPAFSCTNVPVFSSSSCAVSSTHSTLHPSPLSVLEGAPVPAALAPSSRPFKAPAPAPYRGSSPALALTPRTLIPSAAKPTGPKTSGDYYFRVLYCKRSNKKHKAYDDGYLVVAGKKCILKDVEEKIVTQQMVKMEASALGCESTLDIGGYQAEIVEVIKADDYLSGRVFLANRSPPTSLLSAPLASHFKKVGSLVASASSRPPPSTSPSPALSRSSISSSSPSPALSRSSISSSSPSPALSRSSISSSSRVVSLHPGTAGTVIPRPTFQLSQDKIVLNRQFLEGPRKQHPVEIDTCIGRFLRPHQIEGVQFMYDCFMGLSTPGYAGCVLADPMGLGKTLQAIAITWTLLNGGPKGEPEISKAIIVCPATLVRNWDDEFRKWLGSHVCKPLVLDASSKFAEQEETVKNFVSSSTRNKKEAVLIVGYELIQKHLTMLRQVKAPLIVCDEGHRLKNHSGNKTIKGLASIATSRRLLLTGTPVQNNLMEFFAMVDFVNPSFLGSARAFQNTFATPIVHSRDNQSTGKEQTLGEMRSKELARLTAKFVLRRSGNILKKYLPPKIETVLFCPLTQLQSELYCAMLRSKAINGIVATENSAAALTCIIALKKVCGHPCLIVPDCNKCTYQPAAPLPHSLVLGHIGNQEAHSSAEAEAQRVAQQAQLLYGEAAKVLPTLDPDDLNLELSSKLTVLAHILLNVQRNKEKVVVVSSSGKTLNVIQNLCSQRGYEFLRLDGGTKGRVRMDLVHQFNGSPAKWVFLLSAKAGGMGLNLVGANRLVLFEPDWNPAIDAQAMGRIWRDGQTKRVFVYRLLATATIDEKIFQRQIRKQEVAEAVTEDRSDGSRNFSHKNLKELFTYRSNTLCETYDLLSANQDNMELKQKWEFLKPCDSDDAVVRSLPQESVSFLFRWDSRNQAEEEVPDSLEVLSSALLGTDPQIAEDDEEELRKTKHAETSLYDTQAESSFRENKRTVESTDEQKEESGPTVAKKKKRIEVDEDFE